MADTEANAAAAAATPTEEVETVENVGPEEQQHEGDAGAVRRTAPSFGHLCVELTVSG